MANPPIGKSERPLCETHTLFLGPPPARCVFLVRVLLRQPANLRTVIVGANEASEIPHVGRYSWGMLLTATK